VSLLGLTFVLPKTRYFSWVDFCSSPNKNHSRPTEWTFLSLRERELSHAGYCFGTKPISIYSKHHFLSLHLEKPKKCEIFGENLHSKSLQIVRKRVSTLIKHQISGN